LDGSRWTGEPGNEDARHVFELDVRSLFQNQRHAASPGLDQMHVAQKIGHERIAAAGDVALPHSFHGQAFGQASGIADLHAIRVDGDAHGLGIAPVAVTNGVDGGSIDSFVVLEYYVNGR